MPNWNTSMEHTKSACMFKEWRFAWPYQHQWMLINRHWFNQKKITIVEFIYYYITYYVVKLGHILSVTYSIYSICQSTSHLNINYNPNIWFINSVYQTNSFPLINSCWDGVFFQLQLMQHCYYTNHMKLLFCLPSLIQSRVIKMHISGVLSLEIFTIHNVCHVLCSFFLLP